MGGFCAGCGTRDEWWDPAQGGHRFALVADVHTCPGCEVKEQLRDQIPKDQRGAHVKLIPNPNLKEKVTSRGR